MRQLVRTGGAAGRQPVMVGREQAPEPVQIAPGAVDARLGPLQIALRRAVGQHEQPCGVGAIGLDRGRRVDGVALGFAHLLRAPHGDLAAVLDQAPDAIGVLLDLVRLAPLACAIAKGLVADHALGEQAGERLVEAEVAALPQGAGEEACVEQVQHGVLDAADILVDRHPVLDRRPLERSLGLGRAEPQKVPGALDEGVEGIGLAPGRPAAGRAWHVLPGRVMLERVAGFADLDVLGQGHGQLRARHRHDAAGGAMDHRDRAAPVALARHAPIAQPKRGLAAADAQLLQMRDHALLGGRDVESVQEAGIDHPAVAQIRLVADHEARGIGALRQDHRDHRPAVFARELEIALVVPRTAEDRAGAVLHEHEIGDVDRQHGTLDQGMLAAKAGIEADLLGPLERLLAGRRGRTFGNEAGKPGVVRGEPDAQRVIGCDRDEARAEQGVGAGREHLDMIISAADRKPHPGADRAADPALLHGADLVRPAIQARQGVEQLLAVVGDLEEPLRQLAALDRSAGAPAAAVDDLLVGQHRLVDRIPVDPGLLAVDQARLEEVEEHRLLMAIVARIAGRDLARPVDRQPHGLELGAHLLDIGMGPGGRMRALGHGGVLGRQAERVPTHRMENVVALRPLEPADHVAQRVVAHVTHVNPARRIGKHLEHVVLGPLCIGRGSEDPPIIPASLPLGLDLLVRVTVHRAAHLRKNPWRCVTSHRPPSYATAGMLSKPVATARSCHRLRGPRRTSLTKSILLCRRLGLEVVRADRLSQTRRRSGTWRCPT